MDSLDDLVGRLEKVERQNRHIRLCLLASLCIAIGLGVLAAFSTPKTNADEEKPISKTIKANEIILQDKEGKPRIVLGSDKDQVMLTFYDGKGKKRGEFGIDDQGTGLLLRDKDGRPRLELSTTSREEGGVGLVLLDEKERPCASMLLTAKKRRLPLEVLRIRLP